MKIQTDNFKWCRYQNGTNKLKEYLERGDNHNIYDIIATFTDELNTEIK